MLDIALFHVLMGIICRGHLNIL